MQIAFDFAARTLDRAAANMDAGLPPLARSSDPSTSHGAAVAKIPACHVAELRQLLSYDHDSGVLTWRVRGNVAGTVDAKGYVVVKVLGRTYKAARIAWAIFYGDWPSVSMCVDHIDQDKSNNAIVNLRLATSSQNRRNNNGNSGVASSLKGAYRHGVKWRALIWVDGRLKNLGSFDTALEAHEAYCSAAEVHYGEFASGRTVQSTAGRAEREWEAV
jgi:hypothetical protein